MDKILILKAKESDYQQIINLLAKSKLPTEGVKEILSNTLVAKDEENVIGCAAIESYSQSALLRSVAVNERYKGKRIGLKLSKKLIEISLNDNIKEIFLLTETAENYFNKIGFKTISRKDTPVEIQQSAEFSSICPQSATVLKLETK